MSYTAYEDAIAPDQDVRIAPMRPQDAPGVAACFRVVYGGDYPIRTYYEPAALTEANRTADILTWVAITPREEVVGTANMYRNGCDPRVYEGGGSLVIPKYRRRGLNLKLNESIIAEGERNPNITVLFGEPVCNHTHMQKAMLNQGFFFTGLEMDLMPATAYDRSKDPAERVSMLWNFREMQPRPHGVFLPGALAAPLREIYGETELERRFSPALETTPSAMESEMRSQVYDFAQAARVDLPLVGRDLPVRLAELQQDLAGRGVEVLQLRVNLGQPEVGWVVEVLRQAGFFLGGLYPRWFDYDGLFLQRTARRPHWEQLHIMPDFSRLLELVRADWQAVTGGE
ncbi:MAG: hypothetical protein KQJ78_13875 [Deltaproteobacteria bacterium]|nr:hypothetical protein [Deltaproteobacteria bacterium]